MRKLFLLSALGISFFSSPLVFAQAQQIEVKPCSAAFSHDFDQVTDALFEVVEVIEANAPEKIFRAKVVEGLNICHEFVQNYVNVNPQNGYWEGEACFRELPSETSPSEVLTRVFEPKFHKAECEYLQRLLEKEDSNGISR